MGFFVRVFFSSGEVHDFDLEPLLDLPVFARLRDRAQFEAVFADARPGTLACRRTPRLDRDVIYSGGPGGRHGGTSFDDV